VPDFCGRMGKNHVWCVPQELPRRDFPDQIPYDDLSDEVRNPD